MMEFAQGIFLDQNRNPIITFNDLLADGYRKPDTVDELTWELIKDWFGERRIIPRFDFFFKRALRLHFPYYRELMRLDPTVARYDWFVENYKEKYSEDKAAMESIINGGTTREGSETAESTDQRNGGGSSNGTTINKESGQERAIGQSRNNPMSAMYYYEDTNEFSGYKPTVDGISVEGNLGGGIANTHVVNPSATADQYNRNNSVNKGTSNDEYSSHDNGSASRSGSHSETVSNTGSQKVNSDNVRAEIISGRNNKLSEMIDEARATIIKSESWEWFYRQLDKCFYQCYND